MRSCSRRRSVEAAAIGPDGHLNRSVLTSSRLCNRSSPLRNNCPIVLTFNGALRPLSTPSGGVPSSVPAQTTTQTPYNCASAHTALSGAALDRVVGTALVVANAAIGTAPAAFASTGAGEAAEIADAGPGC